MQQRLRFRFRDPELLQRALTHRSRANEEGDSVGNERLEFLGDAVLDLVISELLMQAHPDADEGMLSRARAGAVNSQTLASLACEIGLDGWVRLGRNEDLSGGRAKPSILADAFEAVLGALYADGGITPVREFVRRTFAERIVAPVLGDAKTALQERLQAAGSAPPEYRTTAELGPPHARQFTVEVRAGGRSLGRGEGRSKREAEQRAAGRALEALDS